MKPLARTETVTGTTTASHPGVAVAAGEAAADTDGAGVAPHATSRPRYENLLLPLPPLSCLYHQIVIITGV